MSALRAREGIAVLIMNIRRRRNESFKVGLASHPLCT
jgi:hypothetical protein